jgi:hypothetical protein
MSARSDIEDMTTQHVAPEDAEITGPAFTVRIGAIAGQLLPGMVLPGIIYFAVSRRASVLVAGGRVLGPAAGRDRPVRPAPPAERRDRRVRVRNRRVDRAGVLVGLRDAWPRGRS